VCKNSKSDSSYLRSTVRPAFLDTLWQSLLRPPFTEEQQLADRVYDYVCQRASGASWRAEAGA
jgi:hypothetical protein